MAKYKFVGQGMGVPGLPHEVTDDEAAALGLSDLLKEAVANGSYVEDSGLDTVGKTTRPTRPAEKKEVKHG